MIPCERTGSMCPEDSTARPSGLAGVGEPGRRHGRQEPQVPEELLGMENVVLLPHLGSATEETRVAMGMRVLGNLNAFFNGEDPPDKL